MIGFAAAAALLLGMANGANDNFKGVATLLGSGSMSYRRALAWATIATLLGSLTALVLGSALSRSFAGAGLLPASFDAPGAFLGAVGIGAAATVLLASRLGFPVSTTHALLGGLVGAGMIASAGRLHYGVLAQRFVLPLLLSPAIAFLVASVLYPAARRIAARAARTREVCLCVAAPVVATVGGAAAVSLRTMGAPQFVVASAEACRTHRATRLAGIDPVRARDAIHAFSGGLVSFSRGLNDTPKIAALLLAGSAIPSAYGSLAIALAIALGGWWGAGRVARTMSFDLVSLGPGQGAAANLVTAGLVIGASWLAFPVSMTHVAVGSMAGTGARQGRAHWAALRSVALAWGLTLPLGAALSAAAFLLLRRIPA
ncbi:MAG: inorganic phosphate transporter [Candidatus Eisenbacteria bacterium]